MTLPQEEITRIEADAKNYGEKSHDLYSTTLNASQISYFAGAKAEAVRGREMATGFAEWLNIGFCNYGRGWRKKDFQGDEVGKTYPIAELLDLFILDTQKGKG